MIEIKVEGHPDRVLWFDPDSCRCGEIKDGVSLMNGNKGWWVISYQDLVKMYEMATKKRE